MGCGGVLGGVLQEVQAHRAARLRAEGLQGVRGHGGGLQRGREWGHRGWGAVKGERMGSQGVGRGLGEVLGG